MFMKYTAHIRKDESGNIQEQSVSEHCRHTAVYAAEALSSIGLQDAAYLAGLLHDAGKYQEAFQTYLRDGGVRGSVIHTFQGCRMLLEHFHQDSAPRYEDITAELLTYAVGAHHGQFDCIDETRNSGFEHRITSTKINYEESRDKFLHECADWSEIEDLFKKANAELIPIYEDLTNLASREEDAYPDLTFYIGLLARLILSSVIEGDRRDTAEYMQDLKFQKRFQNREAFWQPYLARVEEKLEEFPQTDAVMCARRKISDQCKQFANNPPGLYRLSVPTGSGKTLSSLRFALAHAAIYGKQRIIFTAPLLSILDQNAQIIREYLGDNDIILEHHSNVIRGAETDDQLDRLELLEESWNAPVIITTMVQLLNTLFKGKTSNVRRFQALSDSILIIDEVQSVPTHMLSLFNLTLNFLVTVCGTTVVLCSATQPGFQKADHALIHADEIVPWQADIWQVFQRTQLVNVGSLRLEEIPSFLKEKMESTGNLLVVCNTKKEAEYLFRELSQDSYFCLHLSASMCQKHRWDVLQKAKEALKGSQGNGKKFILISTQVIEAGVDISFSCVVRLIAGLDNIVQAAGRCNRNGENPIPAPVYLINCTNESLGQLKEIQAGKTAALELIECFQNDPARFQYDLSSDTAVSLYYDVLYRNMPCGYQDYMIDDGKDSLFSLLSLNARYADTRCEYVDKYFLKQGFKTAGTKFQVFDESSEDVIVPWSEGAQLIRELQEMSPEAPASQMRDWLDRAKPWTISVYQYQKAQLEKISGKAGIYEIHGVSVLADGFYDPATGFSPGNGIKTFLEV